MLAVPDAPKDGIDSGGAGFFGFVEGLSALYAAVARIAIGTVENFSDRKAEKRAARLRRIRGKQKIFRPARSLRSKVS
jgi:hypothetical protein